MIVIVAGMHRSGTSALAGLLHSNGVVMGLEERKDFYPPPMKENPKGFFENVRFRRINDQLLKIAGYRVKSFLPNVPNVYAPDADKPLKNTMKDLISFYNERFDIWGFKDPRFCLTTHAWFDVIESMGLMDDIKVLITRRSHEEIRKSMLARGNKENYEGQFVNLSVKYYDKLHYYMFYNGWKPKTMSIDFRQLVFNTGDTAKRLSHFLKHEINDLSFIESKISRQVA